MNHVLAMFRRRKRCFINLSVLGFLIILLYLHLPDDSSTVKYSSSRMWLKPFRGAVELFSDETTVKNVDIASQSSAVKWHTTYGVQLESIRRDLPESFGGRGADVVDANTREKFFAITELSDIFISIKTTGKFHRNRIDLLLKTWLALASDQLMKAFNMTFANLLKSIEKCVTLLSLSTTEMKYLGLLGYSLTFCIKTYIFTDVDDPALNRKTNGHLINTNCSALHTRQGLCCKMSAELDFYLESSKKWFCHVDDDTYVNVPALLHLLRRYRHNEDWYIGRPSLLHPLSVYVPKTHNVLYSFWFATGGAGFCLSRGLVLKMAPFVADGKLMSHCEAGRLPDDCTVGFIISYYLNVSLTAVKTFHSHLEGLPLIRTSQLSDQVTFSYSLETEPPNIVDVPGFDASEDPTRFLSLHCYLFPQITAGCPPRSSSN